MLLKEFFHHPAPGLARLLLGKKLLLQGVGGIIVETEAYLPDDPAAHSARGHKAALHALALGPGTIYIHPMRQYVGMDIVGACGSVLIRALDPTDGLEDMTHRRKLDNPQNLTNGPARLCQAMGITRALHGSNLTDPTCPLQLLDAPSTANSAISMSPRIGINQNKEAPLRFTITGNKFLSR